MGWESNPVFTGIIDCKVKNCDITYLFIAVFHDLMGLLYKLCVRIF